MGLFSKSKSKSPQPSFQSGPPPYTANTGANNSNYAPPSPPRQPVNSDTRALPNGWISQYDPNSQRFFYVYTPTALRQWEHPADKPMGNANRGENASYTNQSQQPYYPQQQQQQQQRFYPQQGQFQPQYVQQPQYMQQPQYGRSSGGGMGYGKMAAAGVGGGLLGYMIGDAMFDDHPDTMVENNYYGDQGGGFDQGGFDGGGFDGGGFDDGGFDM